MPICSVSKAVPLGLAHVGNADIVCSEVTGFSLSG